MKPILFSTPMVQAILNGKKTQTRRIINPQPNIDEESGYVFDGKYKHQYDIHNWKPFFINDLSRLKVNDTLWVRETWRKSTGFPIGYRYDWKATAEQDGAPIDEPWKPSIFMPIDAARIFLKVTNVRIEQIKDISYSDAIAEGLESKRFFEDSLLQCDFFKLYGKKNINCWDSNPIISYMSLWDDINGERSFFSNPWVFVYEFEVIG